MSLSDQIQEDMKAAMKEKDKEKLAALRAVKSELLLASREKGDGKDGEEAELKMLQKLVKQRKESADVYKEQGREDLAKDELVQAEIIEKYLPEQMGEEELKSELQKIIKETGASSPQDMGKVMGIAMKKLAGKADGKTISSTVKELLT